MGVVKTLLTNLQTKKIKTEDPQVTGTDGLPSEAGPQRTLKLLVLMDHRVEQSNIVNLHGCLVGFNTML